MCFLVVDIMENNQTSCKFKPHFDLENAKAIINKQTNDIQIDGFTDTLKYIFSRPYLKHLLVDLMNSNTGQTHFCFGNG